MVSTELVANDVICVMLPAGVTSQTLQWVAFLACVLSCVVLGGSSLQPITEFAFWLEVSEFWRNPQDQPKSATPTISLHRGHIINTTLQVSEQEQHGVQHKKLAILLYTYYTYRSIYSSDDNRRYATDSRRGEKVSSQG